MMKFYWSLVMLFWSLFDRQPEVVDDDMIPVPTKLRPDTEQLFRTYCQFMLRSARSNTERRELGLLLARKVKESLAADRRAC